MKSRKGLMIATLTLVPMIAAALGAASASRPPAAPPTPPIIATVNIGEVIKGLDEYKALTDALRKRGEQFQATIQTKKTAIEDDQKKYETMPTSPEKKELAQKVIRDALQLRFDTEYATQFMDQMEGEQLRDIADRVSAACKELAIKNKYTIVMSDDSEIRPPRGGKEQVGQQIMIKRLWYVDPAHDVTKELIDLMNNQFVAGPKGA